MKKVFQMTRTALTVLVTAGLMTAMGYSSTVEARVIKAGIGLNEKSPQYQGLQKFKEIVEKESKGRLEVKLFPNSQTPSGFPSSAMLYCA